MLTTPSKDAFETPDLVKLSDDLVSEENIEVSSLLHEFSDVFTDSPGLTNLIEHEIRTTTDTTIRLNPYPLPFAMTKVVSEEIDNMLKMKVIEPSESAYSSPIVMVRKKDQSFRFCIDMRALNRITAFDAEPMPCIEDMFSKLSGNKYIPA